MLQHPQHRYVALLTPLHTGLHGFDQAQHARTASRGVSAAVIVRHIKNTRLARQPFEPGFSPQHTEHQHAFDRRDIQQPGQFYQTVKTGNDRRTAHQIIGKVMSLGYRQCQVVVSLKINAQTTA
ncbi:hypothetical protein D3C81_938320 [compost metagenome]